MKSEKEKMLAGEFYNAFDPQLTAERSNARKLLQKLTLVDYSDRVSYQKIIENLLPNSKSTAWIEPPFFCDYGYNICFGENVFINFNCVFLDVMPITIGANVLIGPSVQIYTATHPTDYIERRKGVEFAKKVSIGDDCWIGGGAIILPGVIIGNRCIVGAGAVVTKDVPPDTNVAGNPAKPI